MLSQTLLNNRERWRISDRNFDRNAGELPRFLTTYGEHKKNGSPEFQGSHVFTDGLFWWRWGRVEVQTARPLTSTNVRRAGNLLTRRPPPSTSVHEHPTALSSKLSSRRSGVWRQGMAGCDKRAAMEYAMR